MPAQGSVPTKAVDDQQIYEYYGSEFIGYALMGARFTRRMQIAVPSQRRAQLSQQYWLAKMARKTPITRGSRYSCFSPQLKKTASRSHRAFGPARAGQSRPSRAAIAAIQALIDAATGSTPTVFHPDCDHVSADGTCLDEGTPTPVSDPTPEPDPAGAGIAPPPNCLNGAARTELTGDMPDHYHHMATKYGDWGAQFQTDRRSVWAECGGQCAHVERVPDAPHRASPCGIPRVGTGEQARRGPGCAG